MIDLHELQRRIDGMYAPPYSEEGQEVIGDKYTGKVTEVWQDGELTTTKDGDLYGARSLHQSEKPFLPTGQVLFTIDDLERVTDDPYELYNELKMGRKNQRMVVTDDELRDILAEYREFLVKEAVIDQFEECGNCNWGLIHTETGICTDCNQDIHDT